MKLLIGSRTFSSWSLRPWLALKAAGIDFEENLIPLTPEGKASIHKLSPSKKVPALFVGERVITESVAIIDYAYDLNPDSGLYPSDPLERACMRSAIAEMHSGFSALRKECPMNLRRLGQRPKTPLSDDCLGDLKRIDVLWHNLLARHSDKGPYLGGVFSAADAMFAPVVFRIQAYDLPISSEGLRYCQSLLDDNLIKEWRNLASRETESYPDTESV